ncbi:MAG: ABC transporter permease, partial [Betaproteobacteria bacterium]
LTGVCQGLLLFLLLACDTLVTHRLRWKPRHTAASNAGTNNTGGRP